MLMTRVGVELNARQCKLGTRNGGASVEKATCGGSAPSAPTGRWSWGKQSLVGFVRDLPPTPPNVAMADLDVRTEQCPSRRAQRPTMASPIVQIRDPRRRDTGERGGSGLLS